MTGHQHGALFVRQSTQQVVDLLDADGVEAVRRFVKYQQRRIGQQRCGDTEALTHAERVTLGGVVGAGGQSDDVEHDIDSCRGDGADIGEQSQVLACRERWVERRRVDQCADVGQEGCRVIDRMTEHLRRTCGAVDESEQRSGRRRLAGTVRADEAR